MLHGTRRAWLAYLREASRLAREREDVDGARAVIEDVIENHDNLALGLARRTRLEEHNGGPR